MIVYSSYLPSALSALCPYANTNLNLLYGFFIVSQTHFQIPSSFRMVCILFHLSLLIFLEKSDFCFSHIIICMYKVVNWFVLLDPSFLQAFPCSGVSYVSCSSSLDFSVRIKLLPFRLDYCLTFAFVGFWTGVLPYKQLRLIHMHKLSIWSHIGFFFH
jgi:hypothetical protein